MDDEDAILAAEAMMQQDRERLIVRLDAFGESLAKTRSEAIAARRASGIEEEWLEDEEFYEGIDDANRADVRANFRTKPPGKAEARGTASTRSTVFPNITAPYCDAAAARIGDMLLPSDDRTFAIRPTPVPDMEGVAEGRFPQNMMQRVAQSFPGQPQAAMSQIAQEQEAAKQILAEARERAEKAQMRIDDWHVECQWHAEVRLLIEDAARIGVGVLKGPVPIYKTHLGYADGAIARRSELQPGSKRIDPWNFYPDPACGENIHDGAYTWERDHVTIKQLREMRDQGGYIAEQIDKVIEEGPRYASAEYRPTHEMVSDAEQKGRFEIWYFHGSAERENIEAAGCECAEGEDAHVPVMVTMVNNRVLRVALNPLDTGDLPYDVMVWRQRRGHWTGIGVARQIRSPQRIVTAATRMLMDNAGIAGGPMIVFRQGAVQPGDGRAEIAPRKVWIIAEDATEIADARQAIGVVQVDMLVAEMLQIVQFGLRMAEDVTGLPMLLQGQQGQAPDTVGGMTLLNNNATAVLRRLARTFDDRITEPHVRRYYAWLLQYGEDDEKGDYCIDARGSSALVERDAQSQQVPQLLQASLNPVFGIDPKKAMQELLKSQKFDPKRFEYDDPQWQQVVQNMVQGAQDPRLQIAQMRDQFEAGLQQFQAQAEERLLAMEQAFKREENAQDRELQLLLKQMEQSGAKSISLDQLKARLADTTLKTNTQRDLSLMGARQQALTPPTEPAGRAPDGMAFQR